MKSSRNNTSLTNLNNMNDINQYDAGLRGHINNNNGEWKLEIYPLYTPPENEREAIIRATQNLNINNNNNNTSYITTTLNNSNSNNNLNIYSETFPIDYPALTTTTTTTSNNNNNNNKIGKKNDVFIPVNSTNNKNKNKQNESTSFRDAIEPPPTLAMKLHQ
jgi:hypothetical protein